MLPLCNTCPRTFNSKSSKLPFVGSHCYLGFQFIIESEEEGEVADGDGQDEQPGHDPFQAVAEVVLLEEADRVRPPDVISDEVRVLGPNCVALLIKLFLFSVCP